MRRPRSGRPPFFGFLDFIGITTVMIASGCGNVGNLLLVFHVPIAAKPGCGISIALDSVIRTAAVAETGPCIAAAAAI